MRHQPLFDTRFFFSTAPLPCPYLPGRMERRVVTELIGRDAMALHEQLSLAGFRRSHGIAYIPACAGCDACKAVRVLVDRFQPSRSQRRVWNRNAEITAEMRDAVATHEQFQLFSAYQRGRHGDGDMSKMDFFDYQGLVEDTSVDTRMVEFRDPGGELVGACLTDRMANGLSAVYSFFDPGQENRSLGSHMILWLIDESRRIGLDYVYLGFWIPDCAKMAYKRRFQPMEVRTAQGWVAIDEVAPASAPAEGGRPKAIAEDVDGSLSLGEIL
jgi:arginyl-tRNA--protein-N-Asp/Glu arginylyltransferase